MISLVASLTAEGMIVLFLLSQGAVSAWTGVANAARLCVVSAFAIGRARDRAGPYRYCHEDPTMETIRHFRTLALANDIWN